MPWYAVALMLAGAAGIGLLRVITWAARALGYGKHPTPGYMDFTRRDH